MAIVRERWPNKKKLAKLHAFECGHRCTSMFACGLDCRCRAIGGGVAGVALSTPLFVPKAEELHCPAVYHHRKSILDRSYSNQAV